MLIYYVFQLNYLAKILIFFEMAINAPLFFSPFISLVSETVDIDVFATGFFFPLSYA